jgi:hypothetical protein
MNRHSKDGRGPDLCPSPSQQEGPQRSSLFASGKQPWLKGTRLPIVCTSIDLVARIVEGNGETSPSAHGCPTGPGRASTRTILH